MAWSVGQCNCTRAGGAGIALSSATVHPALCRTGLLIASWPVCPHLAHGRIARALQSARARVVTYTCMTVCGLCVTVCAYMRACMFVRAHARVCVCVCVRAYVRACVRACGCVSIKPPFIIVIQSAQSLGQCPCPIPGLCSGGRVSSGPQGGRV